MLELTSALKAGSEAIGLVSALAQLIDETKNLQTDEANPASLSKVLRHLQLEALYISREFENRLRKLRDNVQAYGLNPAKSVAQHADDLEWYNFLTRARLKTVREELFSISRSLTTFLDDASAMLICQNQQQLAAKAFKASLESKRHIDQLFADPNTPLGVLLDGLLATASRVTHDLLAANT